MRSVSSPGWSSTRLATSERRSPSPRTRARSGRSRPASEALPKPEPDEVWLIAVEHFSEAQLAQAIARNRVPPAALAERAMRYLEDDDPKRARGLLEALVARA